MPTKTYSYYGDFETTTVKVPKEYKSIHDMIKHGIPVNKPQVYSWGFLGALDNPKPKSFPETEYDTDLNRGYNVTTGISLKTFFQTCSSIDQDIEIWFNNSKGFDAHFMVYWLNENGFLPFVDYEMNVEAMVTDENDRIEMQNLWDYRHHRIGEYIQTGEIFSKFWQDLPLAKRNDENLEKAIKYNWKFILNDEYKMFTNENTQIYQLQFGVNARKRANGHWGKYRTVSIRDNLLLFPASVKKMGEMLADYHVDKLGWDRDKANEWFNKQSISYKKYTMYKSYEEFKNDGNEKQYLIQDCFVLYAYQDLMKTYFPKKSWKLTIGSTSYHDWIKRFGEQILESFIKSEDVEAVILPNRKFVMYRYGKRLWKEGALKKYLINQILPTSWLDIADKQGKTHHQKMYIYYNGGLVHLNEKFRGKFFTNGRFFDINSSFPTQMNSEQLMPYGVPSFGNDPKKPFKLIRMDIIHDITNEKGLPFLFDSTQTKREYPKTLKAGAVVYTNSHEIERFKKYYKYKKGDYIATIEYSFSAIPAKKLFGQFVEYWYAIKEQASIDKNPILRAIAKLLINNLYGKMGTKSMLESKVYMGGDKWIDMHEIQPSKFYLPLAITITSLARMMLVDMVGEHYDKFVYGDTDSALIVDYVPEEFPKLRFHATKLGYWSTDVQNAFGFVRRPKQYIMYGENEKGKFIKKMAYSGINFNKYLYDDEDLDSIEDNIELFMSFNFKDMWFGKEAVNQTKPERIVSWGIFIDNINKNVKPIWDYPALDEQKIYNETQYTRLWKEQSTLINKMQVFADVKMWEQEKSGIII